MKTPPEQRTESSSVMRHRRGLMWSFGLVFVLLGAAFAYAASLDHSRAEAWFAGLGVIVAGLALVAALVAAWLALPGYIEWDQAQRRRPNIRIHIEVGPAAHGSQLPLLHEV